MLMQDQKCGDCGSVMRDVQLIVGHDPLCVPCTGRNKIRWREAQRNLLGKEVTDTTAQVCRDCGIILSDLTIIMGHSPLCMDCIDYRESMDRASQTTLEKYFSGYPR